ncbi:carboxymuconolactone decarboxylase family protein [Vibrio mangrovi]|uniref:Carboxymuconolactone decarboxylase family protein n=1 Tax=Vibrio mangrovi TaxID=474394 RepID=A0A1Y6IYU4_9VIBR|nr:carboxymuconolactone decarboxylase family protein [Vibrio mangrovi]MDW6002658.1 carboxymuconolactone decarboxylase family protein [Vibrio mangrovi]SMS02817.1 Carboxymuconolactone decarboxylase family protein [Vibrio mangrovi]
MQSIDDIFQYAPRLKSLTETILFADIWERPQLNPRERSMITLSVLAALGRSEQLPFHLERAEQNGLSKAELGELFTHLAFYAGWPAAVTALDRLNLDRLNKE